MKIIGFFFLLLSLTACSQNVGAGISVVGMDTSGDGSAAATEIHADSETGIHGSLTMGTDIRL
ncbi:MAG: hypothetical protein KJO45_02015 [Sulfurovum sp.]|nr:hypothetical protein [Sulfurovum sp.]